jgi:hypothetical protein
MDNTTNLIGQIDSLVESKTFNLDALDGIKQIKDSFKDTLSSLQILQDKELKYIRDLSLEKSKNAEHVSEIAVLNQQTAQMRRAAEDGTAARFESDKHKAVADAWQSAMAMVFKPNAVRETIQRNHSVWVTNPGGGGYPQSLVNEDKIVREDT